MDRTKIRVSGETVKSFSLYFLFFNLSGKAIDIWKFLVYLDFKVNYFCYIADIPVAIN